ncbi:MAG: pyridoxal phosphate-dependent aminotransferase [Oscillospiraceae bacterium]|nr:pyridoxal phosphate-dependent aminotransferase [Oscillospiraceae bacterium]
MKEISTIAQGVHASTTLTIDTMFKQMKADGIDVIGFGAGEPDFNTPEPIKEAAIRAIHENKTRYTPVAGEMELRRAACSRLKEDCGLDYEPSQIVAASGAKHNVYIALQTLLNPGDEVILPAPYWVSYEEMIRIAGGVPVIVTATEDAHFKISAGQLEAAITPKTKAMILNNPSNPTGMVYTKEELEPLARVCVENDLYVISDEIYYGLVYDGLEFTSFASLGDDVKERTILVNGVSKSYAMTGWRIGYSASNKELAKVMSNYLSHSTSAPSSISQWAAIEALHGPQEPTRVMREEFQERRNYFIDRVDHIDGVSALKPEGAFYVMMNIEQQIGRQFGSVTVRNSDDFAQAFLDQGRVAVVPCTGFGAPNFLRWSYATSMENIRMGLDRLERFLAGE